MPKKLVSLRLSFFTTDLQIKVSCCKRSVETTANNLAPTSSVRCRGTITRNHAHTSRNHHGGRAPKLQIKIQHDGDRSHHDAKPSSAQPLAPLRPAAPADAAQPASSGSASGGSGPGASTGRRRTACGRSGRGRPRADRRRRTSPATSASCRAAALNLILADYCDPAAAAARRGGLARRLHAPRRRRSLAGAAGSGPPIGKDPLALFAKPSLRRDAPRIACCDARGRELFAARRLEELDAQERPDEAARAAEQPRRDECTRNLVADGALTVAELVECAPQAGQGGPGLGPKSLSPRSAGRHRPSCATCCSPTDEIDALLAKRSPAMARLRRREALSALGTRGTGADAPLATHDRGRRPDARAFAAYREQLREAASASAASATPALVRATLDLSPALRGRVAVGRLPLEDAATRRGPRAEQALQRKRTAMRLEDFSRKRFRPAAVAARPVPVLGAF